MMTTPLGPTQEDMEDYGQIDDDDLTVDMELGTEYTFASVKLSFEQTHQLVEAGQLVGESAIAFMRNAAMSRAEEVLASRPEQAESPAAGGS